jgi:hypothetical protein
VSSGDAQVWFIAGTIPLMLAGGGHALLALRDAIRRPSSFTPNDDSVRLEMERTGVRFRGRFPGDADDPSIWRFWLGFNISHGLGAFVFGLICLLVAAHDFDLIGEIDGLRPLTVVVPAAYLALSLGFWFYGPALIVGIATACFLTSAVLSL